MRISILGAGATGQFTAAALTLKGHRVALYSRTPERVSEIRSDGGISIEGILGVRQVPIRTITNDLSEAVSDSELVIIAVPGVFQEAYLSSLVHLVGESQAIWLSPGNGATLLALKLFTDAGRAVPLLIESATVPFAARRTGPATVFSRAIITPFVSALPSERNDEVVALLDSVCDVQLCSNVIESILLNVNALIHPLPALLNWGWIEAREKQFSIYGEGMSSGVRKAIHALDNERVNISEALGLRTLSLDEIYEAQRVPPLYRMPMKIGKADRYEERFITEDVPVGLVTLWSLANLASVPVPTIAAVIALTGAVYERDFLAEGRTIEKLGFGNLTAPQLADLVRVGDLNAF